MSFRRALNVIRGYRSSLGRATCTRVRVQRSGGDSSSPRSVSVAFRKGEGELKANALEAIESDTDDLASSAAADQDVSHSLIDEAQILESDLIERSNTQDVMESLKVQVTTTTTTTTTTTATTPPRQLEAFRTALVKIRKRLFTKHDVLRVHVITNVLLCAICIPRTVQCVYEMFFHLNTVAPMQYELPIIYFLATLRDISSVPLAYKFRKGNPRMMFLLSSYVDFCAWSVAALFMPSYSCIPQLPTPVTTGGLVALTVPLVATIAYSMKDPDENVNAVVNHCSAQERKEAEHDSELKKRAISFLYLIAMIMPCWVFLQAMLPAIWGGEQFFDYMHTRYPSVEELTYDGIMVGATTAAVGVFLNTLKDRRMIGRGAMDSWQAGLTAVWVLFLVRVVTCHPDGGVLFTQLASLQFWKPMPWML